MYGKEVQSARRMGTVGWTLTQSERGLVRGRCSWEVDVKDG